MTTPSDPVGYQIDEDEDAEVEAALVLARSIVEDGARATERTFCQLVGTLATEVQRLRDIRELEAQPKTAWEKVHSAPLRSEVEPRGE